MPVYDWRARTSDGDERRGSLDAADRTEAVSALQADGLYPSSVLPRQTKQEAADRPVGEAPGIASIFRRVPLMVRCAFWRQAAGALDAGFTVHQALTMLSDSHLGQLSGFCRQKTASAARGTPLSQLMAEAPELFGPIEQGLIRAGEASGRLDEQMQRLAVIFEREMEFRNSLRWRLLYLKLVGIAALCCGFVVSVVAPGISARVQGQAYNLGGSALRYLLPLFVVAGAWVGIRLFYAGNSGARVGVDRIKIGLPVLGPLFRKLSISHFARSLGALVGAGLPVGESIEIASESAANVHLTRRFRELVPRVRAGEPLSEVMRETGFFPPQVTQMVRTGEETGRTDEMLDKVSRYYESEVAAASQALAIAAFVGMILIAAVGVAIFAFHFYSGLVDQAMAITES